jgi:hypothetical protein
MTPKKIAIFHHVDLQTFITTYDHPGAIVLLEGKRNVLVNDQDKLTALGRLLASRTRHMIFRSGNADGADHFFSLGVAAVDAARLQVITPYAGHRRKYNLAGETFALDGIDLLREPEVMYHSKQNRRMASPIDRYMDGLQDRAAKSAAYIIRDTVKVTGTSTIPRATFGFFYDDLHDPRTGGTGHTIKTCIGNEVPFIDQRVWFAWLDEVKICEPS